MSNPALLLRGVCKRFWQAGHSLEVLRGVDLELQVGQMVALLGPSGAGKSTLLHIAGLLERPDEGEVWIAGRQAQLLDDRERTALRRRTVGFVYQYHHLLPEFSALENLVVPQMLAGLSRAQARMRSKELLSLVGLESRSQHRPGRLSGGEQQRVALARALANVPLLLLADEPTGNLDPDTAKEVFYLLRRLVKEVGLSALIATHNLDLAMQMDRVVALRQGVIEEVEGG